MLAEAKTKGIPNPRIYSHSLGLFLHEPGPLIGLPWEQVDTGIRGRVRLVPSSTFTAELSVAAPVAEWGGRELRLALEQVLAYTTRGAYFLDGRQTHFHLVFAHNVLHPIVVVYRLLRNDSDHLPTLSIDRQIADPHHSFEVRNRLFYIHLR